jgi:hypothetical protein
MRVPAVTPVPEICIDGKIDPAEMADTVNVVVAIDPVNDAVRDCTDTPLLKSVVLNLK